MAKRRQDALIAPTEPRPAEQEKPFFRKKVSLYKLLPRAGFDWDFKKDYPASRAARMVPDLDRGVVYSIQDAFGETYDNIDPRVFDHEISRIVLRATELDQDQYSFLETDPENLWHAVRQSLEGQASFATHPRMTPAVIHAFVAYALESRLASVDELYFAWGPLIKAVERLHGEFIKEPWTQDTDIWRAYYERPDDARWVAQGDDGGFVADDESEKEEDDEEEDEEETPKVVKSAEFVEEEEDSDGDVEMGEAVEDVTITSTATHTCQTASEHVEGSFIEILGGVRL
jgi:hypothetical protein